MTIDVHQNEFKTSYFVFEQNFLPACFKKPLTFSVCISNFLAYLALKSAMRARWAALCWSNPFMVQDLLRRFCYFFAWQNVNFVENLTPKREFLGWICARSCVIRWMDTLSNLNQVKMMHKKSMHCGDWSLCRSCAPNDQSGISTMQLYFVKITE